MIEKYLLLTSKKRFVCIFWSGKLDAIDGIIKNWSKWDTSIEDYIINKDLRASKKVWGFGWKSDVKR